jgi:hypothetical protein
LEVGVAGHDGFAGRGSEVDEGAAPLVEAVESIVDGSADEETHVGGDLFVAAASRVEFQGKRADLFGEFEFDEVVDVFDLFVCGDVFEFGYGTETLLHLEEFFAGENVGGFDGAGVGDAGFYLIREEAVVEGKGALPFLELLVEGFAEAT